MFSYFHFLNGSDCQFVQYGENKRWQQGGGKIAKKPDHVKCIQ